MQFDNLTEWICTFRRVQKFRSDYTEFRTLFEKLKTDAVEQVRNEFHPVFTYLLTAPSYLYAPNSKRLLNEPNSFPARQLQVPRLIHGEDFKHRLRHNPLFIPVSGLQISQKLFQNRLSVLHLPMPITIENSVL